MIITHTMIYKTLHRKQTIEQHEPHWKSGMYSGAPEKLAVPAPHVTPVVLLLNNTNTIWHGYHVRTSVYV